MHSPTSVIPSTPSPSGDRLLAPGRWLALRMWLLSMLCWWGLGLPFSRLWWLVNQRQLDWILFCYAWEVPAIGWTGVVLMPYLLWRRLAREIAAQEATAFRRLVRYPVQVAALVLGTSTVGYLLGAVQIRYFAALPTLETIKIIVQGPVLGAAFAAAGYLMAERAIRRLPREVCFQGEEPNARVIHSLQSKVFFVTVALMLGISTPIFLEGFTQAQAVAEETRGQEMEQALGPVRDAQALQAVAAQFGSRTTGFIFRRSDASIVAGAGAGTVVFTEGRRDFRENGFYARNSGHFSGRDGTHKVVAFKVLRGALSDGGDAVAVLISPLTDYGAGLIRTGQMALIICGVSLLVGFGLSAMLAKNVRDPIERVRFAATRMAGGDLQVEQVAITGGDEVAVLAQAFDRMARRVRSDETRLREAYEELQAAQAQLVKAEKLSAAGRVISGVAHELNNPLSAILHYVEDLLEDPAHSEEDRRALRAIAAQARRSRKIVRDLLSFVQGRTHTREEVEVRELLGRVLIGVQAEQERIGARVDVGADPCLPPVLVDPAGLEQVLVNLAQNGVQAAGLGGWVRLRASRTDDTLVVTVEDDGPGISPDALPHLFEPFFTTKAPGQGTGLGLSVSLGIVEQHGGTLRGENRPAEEGGGARFTLTLPHAFQQRGPVAAAEQLTPRGYIGTVMPGPPRGRVLIIDDEEPIRAALGRFLRKRGWTVDESADADQALKRLLAVPAATYDAIITDLKMPGHLSGIDLHDRLAETRPDLHRRLIIMSGDVASAEAFALVERTDRPVIQKPFELNELLRVLDRVSA